MPRFYSVNFHGGEDTTEASSFYKRLFGWKEGIQSKGHSELWMNEFVRIVFSRPTPDCPVTPGTITLETEENTDFASFGFFPESNLESFHKPYRSYLDPWENRIWVYIR